MILLSLYHLLAYYFTLVLFGLFGGGLCAYALLLGVRPANDARERAFQRLIHRHFVFFHAWCRTMGLMRVHYHGFEKLPAGGLVLAANHLSLIDITCLLARLPEAVCVFKSAIRRNPVLGAAARRAGYLANDGGHDLVRAAADKLCAGHQLVIFPEGTRARPGTGPGPLKPGFVLMAQRAGVPIQLVHIATNSDVLTKGIAWWKLPRIPVRVDLTLGPLIPCDPMARPAELAGRIGDWFRDPEASVDLVPASPAHLPSVQ